MAFLLEENHSERANLKNKINKKLHSHSKKSVDF